MHPTDEAWFLLQANCHNIPREEAEAILRDYRSMIPRVTEARENTMDKLKIYVDPPPAPRMPPVADVNNSEKMLGAVVLTLGALAFIGGLYWAIWR